VQCQGLKDYQSGGRSGWAGGLVDVLQGVAVKQLSGDVGVRATSFGDEPYGVPGVEVADRCQTQGHVKQSFKFGSLQSPNSRAVTRVDDNSRGTCDVFVQGVHGKHRTVRRACLSEPLAAITLSRVSPEQELLLVPIDGAITLASYGAEFENFFFFHS